MKHFVLSLFALVLLLCGLTLAASFFLKTTVEDMTREAIMSMAPGRMKSISAVPLPLKQPMT